MLLSIFQTHDNSKKFDRQQPELAYFIRIANIIGLFLMTRRTVLGVVWANESWGRYWGWDPKETWAQAILIYSFITHMHKINGFDNTFSLSALLIMTYSSVLMAYFEINYYLSGLHSYGQADGNSSPAIIYISLIVIFVLIVLVA